MAISHDSVGCVVAGQFPRFEARIDPAEQLSRARLHFRPAGGPHWYSVAMKPEGGTFVGVLPKPKKTLKRIDYYIEATDRSFAATRTAEFSPDVASGPAACKEKVVAGALSTASVALEGPVGAPLVPVGFEPDGVVPLAQSPGDGPAASGTTAAAPGTPGAPTGSAGAAAAGSHSSGRILLIGGAVAAGAAVAVVAGGSGGSGGSANGSGGASGGTGSAACQPAPITSSLASAAPAQRCGQAFSVGVVLSNGSCSPLAVQAVQLTQNAKAGTFCSAQVSQFSYAPQVTSVATGKTATVLNFVSGTFCCTGGPCPGVATCAYDESFVVQTSSGPVSAGTVPLQVAFDPSCPICP